MRVSLVVLLVCLLGCQSIHFDWASRAIDGGGIHIRKVDLGDGSPLVCYSEIRDDSLSGVSCQNSLGITEFALGVQRDKLVVKKITPLVSQTRVQTVVDMLTLALFDAVSARLSQRYQVRKSHRKTIVTTAGKTVAEVSQ